MSPRRSPSVNPAFSSTIKRNALNTLPRRARPAAVRLFGSRPDAPDARPGALLLADDREPSPSSAALVPVDLAALRRTVAAVRDLIGYPTYDVSLSLVDDDFMKEINGAARGVAAPTDVLSFCFQDDFAAPGVLGPVQFDRAEYYNLGDMLIDVDYVRRKCEEDRNLHGTEEWKSRLAVAARGDASEGVPPPEEEGHEDDGYEYVEVEVDEYDDRGVAPAMQYIYDPEIRIHMLVVHGMLHLVGYDHIEDDDYELMVVREDEVLAKLRQRLGEDFGVKRRLPAGDSIQQQLC